MLIKFCGIKRQKDADMANKLGADFCGFIFHNKSPRYLKPEEAAKIETGSMSRVGVFVKQNTAEIINIMKTARLDFAQLHGQQDDLCAKALGSNVIRTLWPAKYKNQKELIAEASKYTCKYFLLDSGLGGGGHGIANNFETLANLALPNPWFLAGGLSAENIPLALSKCKPNGLDINSGVEDAPGIKNAEKMGACMRLVR